MTTLNKLIDAFETAVETLLNEHSVGWNENNCRPGMADDIDTARQNLLNALQVAVPEGWQLVPIVPTPEMLQAGARQDWVGIGEGRDGLSIMPDNDIIGQLTLNGPDLHKTLFGETFDNLGIWPAMLAAAPTFEPESGVYRRRNHTVEAYQFNNYAGSRGDRPGWLIDAVKAGKVRYIGGAEPVLVVDIPGMGEEHIGLGGWVIRDSFGDIYLCEDQLFKAMYEK